MDWYSISETAIALFMGSIVSFLSISMMDKRRHKVAVKISKERLFQEIDMLRESLKSDFNHVKSCEENSDLKKRLIVTPALTSFDFRAVEDSFYQCSGSLSSAQRRHYAHLIKWAKQVKSMNDDFVEVMVRAYSSDEFEEEFKRLEMMFLNAKRGAIHGVICIDAIKDDRERISTFEAGVDWIEKELENDEQ